MFKKNPVIVLTISISIIAIIFFVMSNDNAQNIISNNELSQSHSQTSSHVSQHTDTIANQWQWTTLNEQAEIQAQKKPLPFTTKFVYEALKAVKLDEDGNVIYDHDALLSLDEALLRIQNKLDSESLAILQTIIKDGLPGKAGEQTAKIVGDYYHYLEAKDEFSRTSEALADTGVHKSVNAVENDQLLYSELQALRDVHLGNDVSSGLFRVTDADAQYMFESMKLDLVEGLTEEEIQQKRLEIKQQHIQHSVNISNWPDRYRAFQEDKQKILSASLDEQEKQNQVTQLLKSYFSADERKRITHLSLDQL